MEDHNRVFVGWPGGYFVTSLDPEFHKALQEMVADLGPPSVVEFRASDEGWHVDDEEDDFFSDREANPHDGSMYGDPEGGSDVVHS